MLMKIGMKKNLPVEIIKIIYHLVYPSKSQLETWKKQHTQKFAFLSFKKIKGCPICYFLNMRTTRTTTVFQKFNVHFYTKIRYPCKVNLFTS